MGTSYVPNTQSVTGSSRLEMNTPALLRLYWKYTGVSFRSVSMSAGIAVSRNRA